MAYDIDTRTVYKFADTGVFGVLRRAELLIGHNIIGFDNRVVQKLFGIHLNDIRCHDTFVMSQVLRYKRKHKHGLKGWGEAISNSKIEYDWSGFSPEMMKYCVQDVMLNADVYFKLIEEYTLSLIHI